MNRMNIPKDISKQIEHDFKENFEQAFKLVEIYLARQKQEVSRVLRCVLFLSKGNLKTLEEMIHIAQTDYRDAIFWAEYIDFEKDEPKQVRDFSKPFGINEINNS